MAVSSDFPAPHKETSPDVRGLDRLSLTFGHDPSDSTSASVSIRKLDTALMNCIEEYILAGGILASVFRIAVAHAPGSAGEYLPDVYGHYQILDDGIRFIPHFPFERGLTYRASFDAKCFEDKIELLEIQIFDFCLPKNDSGSPAKVMHIYPSSDLLPENLLRFYVCFSEPMQRGQAVTEILLLGPDEEPAPDVLYRAPVELWDRSMRCLTVLLDPGRMKRGLGPNRELGPPLNVGQDYTLVVRTGMLDLSGRQLQEARYKRFRIAEAIREPVAVEHWKIERPVINSRRPLTITFPRPLDWALLSQAISLVSENEQSIKGLIVIDEQERRWSLTPTSPWAAGNYHVHVATNLEDVCGNSIISAFDRPLRSGNDLAHDLASCSFSFVLV